MEQIPQLIEKIATGQASKHFRWHYRWLSRWCEKEDLLQFIYEQMHKEKLWDCQDGGLIFIVAKRACLDFLRSNVQGFRKRRPVQAEELFDTQWGLGYNEKYDECLTTISLHKLLDKLPEIQQFIVKSLLEGETQKDIGDRLKLTESRISQIRVQIIDRLIALSKKKPFAKPAPATPAVKPPKQKPKPKKKTPPTQYVHDESIDFRGFCKIHPGKKVFNKKRGLCINCYMKLHRLGMHKYREVEYMPFLKRRLKHGEMEFIKKQYKN